MACDPGRQLFADQLHTHGFLFLDNYLDDILAGPNQELMIDLVKTPGRRRVKPTISKLKAIPLSFEIRHEETAQEVKQRVIGLSENDYCRDIADTMSLGPSRSEQNDLSVIAEDDESVEPSRVSIPISPQKPVACTPSPAQGVASLALRPRQDATRRVPETISQIESTMDNEEVCVTPIITKNVRTKSTRTSTDTNTGSTSQVMNATASSSTFHSIAFDSPDAGSIPQLPSVVPNVLEAAPPRTPPASPVQQSVTRPPSIPHMDQSESMPQSAPKLHAGNFTAPLPEIPPWNPSFVHANDAVTAPLPSVLHTTASLNPFADLNPSTQDLTPPQASTHKVSVPIFPNLPGPMALHKPTRAPQNPSTGMGLVAMGSATPAPVGGKRSSWLIKAREAKTMEETGKRMSALGTGMAMAVAVAVPGTTVGAKRKSGDMLDSDAVEVEEEERLNKIAKITKIADGEPPKAEAKDMQQRRPDDLSTGMRLQHRQPAPQLPIPPPPLPRYQELVTLVKDPPDFGGQEGMLDRLKRTVEGLGARVGKSLGKSLGGVAAVNALAEARAAAEARIAERNKDEGNKTSVANIAAVSTSKEEKILGSPSVIHSSGEARLSVSDLVTKLDVRGQETSKAFHIASPVHTSKTMTAGDESTSTTPPNSPPTLRASFKLPSGPVFRPPPVFVPPPSAPVINQQARTLTSVKDFSFNLPAPTFSKPTSPLGLGTRISPPSLPKPKQPFPLSTQSTLESITSERVFDTEEDVPAWMPMTQDTEYSFETQPLAQNGQYQRTHELDEDDSWPLGEKLSTDPVWVFGNANKEDSLTWSTLPTESQRAESGPVRTNGSLTEVESQNRGSLVVPGAFDKDVDREYGENYLALGESEIEEPEETGKITSMADRMVSGSQDQSSLASSSSQTSLLGQASKLANSVLGTGRRGKTEVKSLQLAAVAAKKQQEEMDKKATRLREMENRRQLALQRKAEEDRSKAMEQERKMKEDGERRKREREENTDKRPKGAAKKEEDNTKKRKVFVEIEKKVEGKKLASKIAQPNLSTSTVAKITTNTTKPPPALTTSTGMHNMSQQVAATSSKSADMKPTETTTATKSTGKGKGKAAAQNLDDDLSDKQPSQVVQKQMAARVKAQIRAVTQPEAEIELPDINSDMSDSEDENQPRTFDPPGWAQSPELRQALQMQSTMNPDDIFGEIRPLKMEELFRTRTSRFRARTSSANWHGSDRLTAEEVREYTRRMGFQ